jgi:hypothetical protein
LSLRSTGLLAGGNPVGDAGRLAVKMMPWPSEELFSSRLNGLHENGSPP